MKIESTVADLIPAAEHIKARAIIWLYQLLSLLSLRSIPVSYTHLDVYKRQGITISTPSANWISPVTSVVRK